MEAFTTRANATRDDSGDWSEDDLASLESRFPKGFSATQLVQLFRSKGEALSEATIRKYVQLGLLPRSIRVARAGRGSVGLYPVTTLRRLVAIRALMADGHRIEDIQRDYLFVRGELDSLEAQLQRVFDALQSALGRGDRRAGNGDPVGEAREVAAHLMRCLNGIEKGISQRARMRRAAL